MKKRLLSSLITGPLVVVCMFVFSGVAAGDTVYVDPNGFADFTTIQAAIDDIATIAGDVIIVRPGTYIESINMNGKAITLRSTDPTDGAVVLATVIDGNAAYIVITCENGEDPNTVIDGFVITNGYPVIGSGMYNVGSSPTVTNCTFSGNPDGSGSGMYNDNSSPAVTNCLFSGNTADYYSGGMTNLNNSSPKVTNCTFSNNTGRHGGGMHNDDSSPTVIDCTFSGNTASWNGGGIFNNGSSPVVSGCTFSNNTAQNGTGGGISNFSFSPSVVTECTFSGNTGQFGGGMYNGNSTPIVTDCTFSRNTGQFGGGMCCENASPKVTDCTFSGNKGQLGGGMYSNPTFYFFPEVSDSYYCGNIPTPIYASYTDGGGNTFYDHCPPPKPIIEGDIDGDGDVDFKDFAIFANNWLEGK